MKFEYMYGIPALVDVIFEAGVNLLEKPSLKAELTEMKYKLDEQFKLVPIMILFILHFMLIKYFILPSF